MTCDYKPQPNDVCSYGILANSIKIPVEFQHLAGDWHGSMDCMLYTVSSSGGLFCGSIPPRGCYGDICKHYLTIWRDLRADLDDVHSTAVESGHSDKKALERFLNFVDGVVETLEESYGLGDWDCWDE